jgi:hypothetical protein
LGEKAAPKPRFSAVNSPKSPYYRSKAKKLNMNGQEKTGEEAGQPLHKK